MHLTYWSHLSGLLLSLCRVALVQCQLLKLTPRIAEVGDDVRMDCKYVLTSETNPRVTIEFKDSEIWELKSASGNISIGQSYEGRIQHSPQESYRNSVTITLTNVTKDDEGSYKCALNMPRKGPTEDGKNLTVYVPPRSLKVYVTPQAPYTESKKVSHSPNQYEPVYTVICTFFVSPDTDAHIWSYKILRGNDTFQPIRSSVVNGNVYDIYLSNTQLTLTREDNGEKSVKCEVTWRKDTDREKIYSAQLETPLNVTFVEETIIMGVPDIFTEGETLSVTCRSGSANPPQHIDWRINDYITEGIEVTHEPGEYNGQKTVSTLRVTAERWMNGREVVCCHSVEEANLCKSPILNVTFPPTILTMTVSAPDNVTVGSIVTITCSTNSSNPVAQIRWTVNLGQHGTSSPATHDGEFGGKIYTSSYEFEVQESHLTKAITCKVFWKDVLLDELTRSYSLGPTTSSTSSMTTTTMLQLESTELTTGEFAVHRCFGEWFNIIQCDRGNINITRTQYGKSHCAPNTCCPDAGDCRLDQPVNVSCTTDSCQVIGPVSERRLPCPASVDASDVSDYVLINYMCAFFTDLPRVEEDSLLISLKSDTITLSWETPSGEYDTITIQQCEKITGRCTEHVATGLRGLLLTVDQDVEYEFFLVLYRADQVVVKAGPFVEKQDANLQLKAASKTAPVNAGAIAGGAVGGLVFIALIVAVTVLIVKRRRVVLKSCKGPTSDVPAQAYENEEVSNSAVAQAAPQNNEGGYEEIGIETQRVENKCPLYENGHLEGTPQGAKESAYSGLGPRGPSAPNVYDQLSAYENQVIVQ